MNRHAPESTPVSPQDALWVSAPTADRALPVLVSIPHFGKRSPLDVDSFEYSETRFKHFARGFADTFAAELYGDLSKDGATVLAMHVSRMFVDVNRPRDRFNIEKQGAFSKRGVIRTHTMSDRPIFTRLPSLAEIEQRLCDYYDPYFDALSCLLTQMAQAGTPIVLLDAHTGSGRRMRGYDVILGTRFGKTADEMLVSRLQSICERYGLRTGRDIKGYAGGEIVRRFGDPKRSRVHAVQLEINSGPLQGMNDRAFIDALIRGESPGCVAEPLEMLSACVREIVHTAGTWFRSG